MSATDWTHQTDPMTNAETLGSMVKCALIESASHEAALRGIQEALNKGDVDDAKRRVENALVGRGVLDDFKAAWYGAIPRHGGDPTSYG